MALEPKKVSRRRDSSQLHRELKNSRSSKASTNSTDDLSDARWPSKPDKQLNATSADHSKKRNREPTAANTRQDEQEAPKASKVKVDDGLERDHHRLMQRQKQIEYGKNTIGYDIYIGTISSDMRSSTHPRTPDIHKKVSKRAWDAKVRAWRRALHQWDPKAGNDVPVLGDDAKDTNIMDNSERPLDKEPPSGGVNTEAEAEHAATDSSDLDDLI